MSLSRHTMEDRLPLEQMPLACTFGSPLNLHVPESMSLQGPVDLDHHRVEFLVAHQQWLPMIVHNLKVHPGAVWLVQSEPDLLIAGPGHCGQIGIGCPQPFVRNGVQLAQCLHLETLAFLLRLDLLWGWLNLCVGAISLLTSLRGGGGGALPPLPFLGHEATNTGLAYTPCHRRMAITTQFNVLPCCGHEATDTALAYAPVSQAHRHYHTLQCFALLHCSADQFCTTLGGC